jgi:hypothetical protein
MRTATKAMIKLLALANRKRGGFFVVKRATGGIIRARLFQGHIALDNIDNVEAVEQILDKAFWNHPSPRLRSTLV